MLSKSVKAKRRLQAARAQRIGEILWASASADVDLAMAEEEISAMAAFLSRFSGKELINKGDKYTSPDLCSALGHCTAGYILEQSGM